MSTIQTAYPFNIGLYQASRLPGVRQNPYWRPRSSEQEKDLDRFFVEQEESSNLPWVQSIATTDMNAMETFLRRYGFNFHSPQFLPGDFGIASILELLVQWKKGGRRSVVESVNTGQEYPAATFPNSGYTVYQSRGHPYPVVFLMAKRTLAVYMTRVDGRLLESQLFHFIFQLKRNFSTNRVPYGDLVFPMVDLDKTDILSRFTGIKTDCSDGRELMLTTAYQRTVLQISEVGDIGQDAYGETASSDPPLVIDGQFLIWCEQATFPWPLVAVHCNERDWRNPNAA